MIRLASLLALAATLLFSMPVQADDQALQLVEQQISTPDRLILPGSWMVSPEVPSAPVEGESVNIKFEGVTDQINIAAGKPAEPMDAVVAARVVREGLTESTLRSFLPVSYNGEVVLMTIERLFQPNPREPKERKNFYALAVHSGGKWIIGALAGMLQYESTPRMLVFDPRTGGAVVTGSYATYLADNGRHRSTYLQLDSKYLFLLIKHSAALTTQFENMGGTGVRLPVGLSWDRVRGGYSALADFDVCNQIVCSPAPVGRGKAQIGLVLPAAGFAAYSVKSVALE